MQRLLEEETSRGTCGDGKAKQGVLGCADQIHDWLLLTLDSFQIEIPLESFKALEL